MILQQNSKEIRSFPMSHTHGVVAYAIT